jgi:hypothetical protein
VRLVDRYRRELRADPRWQAALAATMTHAGWVVVGRVEELQPSGPDRCATCIGTGYTTARNERARWQELEREYAVLTRQYMSGQLSLADAVRRTAVRHEVQGLRARRRVCHACQGMGSLAEYRIGRWNAAMHAFATRAGVALRWYHDRIEIRRPAVEDGPWLDRLREWEANVGATDSAPARV